MMLVMPSFKVNNMKIVEVCYIRDDSFQMVLRSKRYEISDELTMTVRTPQYTKLLINEGATWHCHQSIKLL
jgi:hypothetical protein